jgi:hypothetical protein
MIRKVWSTAFQAGFGFGHGQNPPGRRYSELFPHSLGTAHVEGGLTLDYPEVRRIAYTDLKILEGRGDSDQVEANL